MARRGGTPDDGPMTPLRTAIRPTRRAPHAAPLPTAALVAAGFLATGFLVTGALASPAVGLPSDDAQDDAQDDAAPRSDEGSAVPTGDRTVSGAITAEELRGHVQVLASDALKGRPMGSAESMIAAEYCADRLEAAGLEPGAADGTFFQRIPFGRTVYAAPPELRLRFEDGSKLDLVHGQGFTFRAGGVVSDAGGLRCVLVESEEDVPGDADRGVALVFKTSAGRARRWLRVAGHPDGRGFGLIVIPNDRAEPGEPEVPDRGRMLRVEETPGPVQASVIGDAAARVVAGDLASLSFVTFGEAELQDDANVVAKLPGTGGPEAGTVLLCAHRDHVGELRLREGQPTPDDLIRNGADDDASGCAVVMEIAEAIAAGGRPARSLVVVLVTGEEAGFVGSRHYVANPTVPLEQLVVALNFEMLGRPDEEAGGPGSIWLTGDSRSNLGPKWRELGVDIKPDGRAEMGFFRRSDNVPFAQEGVVAQTLSSYGMHTDYHKVTDEWDTLDYEHMTRAASLCLAAVRTLVHGDWAPKWNEGEPKL